MTEIAGTLPCAQADEGFEARREALVWQAIKPDRYPHAIWPVFCEKDIVNALAYARVQGLRVSVVSGGHSYIGHGIQDGTLLLDLSRLKGIAIDVDNRRGWIEPGVRVAEFDAALERAGLAFPIGHDPNVGLVGFLLGGGMGWNPDRWGGMACFNVVSAEMILPSGTKIVADNDHNADLFWAVRGAGPNVCGVVTRFEVRLFPRPSAIRKCDFVYSLDALERVFAWLESMSGYHDESIELSLAFVAGGEADQGSEPQRQCIVSLIIFAETEAEAAGLAEPYTSSVPTVGLISSRGPTPMTFNALLHEAAGEGRLRRAVESIWTDDPYLAARAAAASFASAPSASSIIYIGLRVRDTLPADAACSILQAGFVFVDAAWRHDADDAINRAWVDTTVVSLHPYDRGGYINETDWERRPERVAGCYSVDAFARLKDINRLHDPDDMFVKAFDMA